MGIEVVTKSIFVYFNCSRNQVQQHICVLLVKVEQVLPPVFYFDEEGVVGGVEPLFIYLSDVRQRYTHILEILVSEAFHAHVVKSFLSVLGRKHQKSIFGEVDDSVDDGQNVNIEAGRRKLLELRLLLLLNQTLPLLLPKETIF